MYSAAKFLPMSLPLIFTPVQLLFPLNWSQVFSLSGPQSYCVVPLQHSPWTEAYSVTLWRPRLMFKRHSGWWGTSMDTKEWLFRDTSYCRPTADHVQITVIWKPAFEMFAQEEVNVYPQHKMLTVWINSILQLKSDRITSLFNRALKWEISDVLICK